MAWEQVEPEARVTVTISRAEASLIRAAAILAEFSDPRRRAEHLAEPLEALAARIEAALAGGSAAAGALP